jgi:hypothetical protein
MPGYRQAVGLSALFAKSETPAASTHQSDRRAFWRPEMLNDIVEFELVVQRRQTEKMGSLFHSVGNMYCTNISILGLPDISF